MMILDVGPKSGEMLTLKIQGAKTVLWNGPLGAFEIKPFAASTPAVAGVVARLTREGRRGSVAGGGDTVAGRAAAGAGGGYSYGSDAGGDRRTVSVGKKVARR